MAETAGRTTQGAITGRTTQGVIRVLVGAGAGPAADSVLQYSIHTH